MQEQLVYPVYSRRSEGISVGIDLFPDAKHCSFDCPYCEVHPFFRAADFSAEQLRQELAAVLSRCAEAGESVRDIAIAGHGEPLLSPLFGAALEAVIATKRTLMPELPVVLITNALALGDDARLDLLEAAAKNSEFHIWAKLDAGSAGLFYRMSGLAPETGAFEQVQTGILKAGRRIPVILQTMLACVEAYEPDERDFACYAELVRSLLGQGARVERIDLYTVSRKPVSQRVHALEDGQMLKAADRLASGIPELPVRVYGRTTRLR